MNPRPRILAVTRVVPGQPVDGWRQRVTAHYRALATLGEVESVFVGRGDPASIAWPTQGFGKLIDVLPEPPIEQNLGWLMKLASGNRHVAMHHAALFRNLRGLYRPVPQTAARFRAIADRGYDLHFVIRWELAWGLNWVDPDTTILDIDDVPSQAHQPRFGQSGLKRLLALRRQRNIHRVECRALADARVNLVCSPADAQYLGNSDRVALLANCYWPQPDMDPPPSPGIEGRILYIGLLGHGRIAGLTWFVEQVLPIIRRQVPAAHLEIAGKSDGRLAFPWPDHPAVKWLGAVDRVGPAVRLCALEIVPLLEGQGTRIKIAEALAYGKPVVSTTVGAYGHPMDESHGLIRRDDPLSFAKACIEVMIQPHWRERAATTGREYVREHLSRDAFEKRLIDLAQPILNQGSRRSTS